MKFLKNIFKKITVISTGLLFLSYANAAGLEKVNELLQTVSDALAGAAVVVVTIAVFWCGYKVIFGGQTIREVAPILIGGVIIGSASAIASMLVG